MILVTSAFGTQGRLLVPKLVLRTVHAGVRTVYHLGPSVHPGERAMGLAMIEAALDAGVEHLVLSSVLYPIITGLIRHELKRDIEERLVESGLNLTILQPGDFLQSQIGPSAFACREFRYAYSLDRRRAVIDVGDLTDVAAKVLLEGAPHYGATYELSREPHGARDRRAGLPHGRRRGARDADPARGLRRGLRPCRVRTRGRHELRAPRARGRLRLVRRARLRRQPNVLAMLLGRAPTTTEQVLRRLYLQGSARG